MQAGVQASRAHTPPQNAPDIVCERGQQAGPTQGGAGVHPPHPSPPGTAVRGAGVGAIERTRARISPPAAVTAGSGREGCREQRRRVHQGRDRPLPRSWHRMAKPEVAVPSSRPCPSGARNMAATRSAIPLSFLPASVSAHGDWLQLGRACY